MSAAFGIKVGMTHIYDTNNRHVPVTIVRLVDQAVVATDMLDNNSRVVIAAAGRKRINKPQRIELEKLGIDIPAVHRRGVLANQDSPKVGQTITVNDFSVGQTVKVRGIGKGKGFAGTVKRHGFSRGPETHGSKNVRKPGSIGGGYPQRVVPGRRMPGHLGARGATVRGLTIMAVNQRDRTLAVSGAIPGPNRGRVFIETLS